MLFLSIYLLSLTIKMKAFHLLTTASLLVPTSAQATVYLIRHGEKPSGGANGLSAQGQQRAQCLKNVFGPDSQYNIQYIMAETPKKGKLPYCWTTT